jgi:hypothetical protein
MANMDRHELLSDIGTMMEMKIVHQIKILSTELFRSLFSLAQFGILRDLVGLPHHQPLKNVQLFSLILLSFHVNLVPNALLIFTSLELLYDERLLLSHSNPIVYDLFKK